MSELPYLIDWAITSSCNLNCRHCRGMMEEDLTTEQAKALIGEIAKLRPGWVIVEGGEAFLHRDIFELLSLMKDYQLNVHLITNGMQLNDNLFTAFNRQFPHHI